MASLTYQNIIFLIYSLSSWFVLFLQNSPFPFPSWLWFHQFSVDDRGFFVGFGHPFHETRLKSHQIKLGECFEVLNCFEQPYSMKDNYEITMKPAFFVFYVLCLVCLCAFERKWIFYLPFGEQGWCSGESTRLPPMWHGFDSWSRRHMWVEFVVGSRSCSEKFFSWYSGFPLSSKTNTSKFHLDLGSVPN